MEAETLILGGGLAGISSSFHLGHKYCTIIEKNPHLGGHAYTHYKDGAFWDEGPHVSFTKHEYIKQILAKSCSSDIINHQAVVGNYFQGNWIPHPAQCNLSCIPEPLARQCLDDFFAASRSKSSNKEPFNYQEWLDQSFGLAFSRNFPSAYTQKYWTCNPDQLTIDWVGSRVFRPNDKTIMEGYFGKPKANAHYINSFRYPSRGGFASFISGMSEGVCFVNDEVVSINLDDKKVRLLSGAVYKYNKLISSIPLDLFINLIDSVPSNIKEAASNLRCSSLLLVNLLGRQSIPNPNHWMYVYDKDLYSTRITQTHLLSPLNTPKPMAGIQVEVYESPYKAFQESHGAISEKVKEEILKIGLLDQVLSIHCRYIKYANVIFDHNRRSALDSIFSFLERYGLVREPYDLEAFYDWKDESKFQHQPNLMLAGRFGQWNYFWSDDCILRGRQIGDSRSRLRT